MCWWSSGDSYSTRNARLLFYFSGSWVVEGRASDFISLRYDGAFLLAKQYLSGCMGIDNDNVGYKQK